MKSKLIFLAVGVVLGLVLAFAVPPLLGPLVPEGLRAKAPATEGRVVAKKLQADRLLLTVDTSQGACLATFLERVAEIDLLVAEGDRVEFDLPDYQPFVTDPTIRRVTKGEPKPEPPRAEAAGDAEPESVTQEPTEPAQTGPGQTGPGQTGPGQTESDQPGAAPSASDSTTPDTADGEASPGPADPA